MPALLELAEVTVRYGGLAAVDNVSFSLEPGEVCAVIGPNGAGKTTLFNTVTGNAPTSGGRILFRGEEIQRLPPHAIAARGIRRTFQQGGLFGELSALENVLTGLHTGIVSGLVGLLLRSRRALAAEREATRAAYGLLQRLGIAELAERPARELSGGQQRLVEIARALAGDPPLLLLDEPAVGLSPPMRAALEAVIGSLAREHGTGILLIEHAIELVMNLADRVIVLNYGAKIADAPPAEARANKTVLEAYLGHA
ncbi:MAG TPA: ABC transporter ATP-binding protein [Alphaproteobacteria bacterium]|nr:ABC transporter ATP-binding protein [Alphaproteobacteria bacterium]